MYRRFVFLAIIILVAFSACCEGAVKSVKPRSKGVYIDSKGTRHPWEVNEAHTLIWDGKPFIPVGGMFCFKYLTFDQSEENWKEDTAALELLKEKGIRDLYINPVGRAADFPVAAWQRVVNYLDDNGFRYGIELSDGMMEPFEAYIVNPQATPLRDGGTATLGSPGASQALYTVSDPAGNMLDSGVRDISKGNASLRTPSGSAKLHVVTRSTIDVLATGFGSYWDRYPIYRKCLLGQFSTIKLGPGFRFFVDPFLNEMGMRGEASSAIPDSPRFRAELALYLKEKYPRIEDLVSSWVPGESLPGGYTEAARFVPMQQGAGHAINPETARLVRCTGKMWNDISRFRDESVLRYMNDVSDLLKSKIANVPVIYKWTHPYSIFTNTDPKGGFDGLGMEIYSVGEELGRVGVHVYSQVEDAARTQWLIVTETQDTSDPHKPTMGYPSEEQMHSDLDWLGKAGAKGFYTFGFQLLPQPAWNNFELLRDPKQLTWLKNYREKLGHTPNYASNRPPTLYYPIGAGTSAYTHILSNGSCWIPTERKGRSLGLPEGLDGYCFEDEGDTCTLWAPGDPQKITLSVPKGKKVQATLPGGKPTGEFDSSGDHLSLTLGKEPVLLRGIPHSRVFPSNLVKEQIEKFGGLVATAKARGLQVEDYQQVIDKAKKIDCEAAPREAYEAIKSPMVTLRQKLAYIWIEGEMCTDHNFSEVLPESGCSAGKFLQLMKSPEPLGSDGYRARYSFEAKIESDYEIWLAGTPPALNWASPVFFFIDSGEPVGVTAGPYAGYHGDFVWTHLGTVKITPGNHILTIQLAGRRKVPNTDYVLYIDALVISPSPFRPHGTVKP